MKNDIIFCDKQISNINDEKLNLSVLYQKQAITTALFEINNKKYHKLSFKNIPENIPENQFFINELNNEVPDKRYFNKVYLQIATNRVTIVPESFFKEENYADFFNFSFPKINDNIIKYQLLQSPQVFLIFDVDKEILQFAEEKFSGVEIIPHAAAFINNNLKKSTLAGDELNNKVFVQVFKKFIDIMYVKDKNLKFYNTYSYKTSNDILYYIINLFEQLKINREKTDLVISGLIEKNDIAIINLKKFIKFVSFESLDKDFNYYYKFQEIPPHYFFNFLSLNK